MDLLQQVREAEKCNLELSTKIKLIDSQIGRLLAELGYESEKEAIEEFKELQGKLPEYSEKLEAYLKKVKKLLEV